MRCSSCEPLLDRYVEGTLSAREMSRVAAHLRTCPHCESLLTELRVVDALLATTAPVELAPNFTFAVMAEARSTPVHVRRKLSLWAVATFYVIGAWIALSGLYAVLGGRVPYLASSGRALAHAGSQGVAALSATAQSVSPAAPLVLGSVIGVLLLDALIVIGGVILYRSARARLAAHLDRSEAV
ncbi:MAG TPA: zf-HC2 domain-containing protein [Alphaproteobacteria bacterium]|nr:zf-HC2 domain-containing protein [Alphaproteobacteria bacterium]